MDEPCRLYKQKPVSIDYYEFGCPIPAPVQYKEEDG